MKLRLIVPAGLLLVGGMSACSGPSTPAAADQQRAPAAAEQTQTQSAGRDSGDEAGEQKEKEEPLTGEVKEKAEAAALKKFPGTVKKSEHDTEKPGLYAVEVEQDGGKSIEVYIDKDFTVVDTKTEDGDTDGD
ncbi:PepSY domain-containing protein [Krasilnikovia sp. MM14-A1004]|uniref:PepSY domain-containing protein n=1 Tax=Krasilnikovia sp. MM14-A1004 TaxID=3373541 RepID=UPI00399D05CE